MSYNFNITATTLYGLEEVLAEELRSLGALDIEVLNRAVQYKGDLALMYKSNLMLRTAVKILRPISTFRAFNEDQLYQHVRKINWDNYFDTNMTFAIDGSTSGEIFTHSKYAALKSKDAIADQFRDKYGLRPSVDTENPDIRINVHISNEMVHVSLDSSGNILSKRNYRLNQTEASMNEVLAAGIILLSGWNKDSDFIDPMCGSGTLPIEAALIAHNIPPGKNRNFGFQTWLDFDKNLWDEIKADSEQNITTFKKKITAYEIDKKALSVAIINSERAGVKEFIDFKQMDFFESSYEGEKGHVVINPPYGERIEVDEIMDFYKSMGTRLKHFYPGCNAWVISSNFEALKHFGLRPTRKIKLFNGPLECRLHKFELYKGSKRDNYL
ncbi:MAG: class I SAM-dependent RNA methyltransferase [Saprospiraceae bacterium]|nr:class I SAM-dependent RNA methyltransferase [Candidatus Vicinibacter affinis]